MERTQFFDKYFDLHIINEPRVFAATTYMRSSSRMIVQGLQVQTLQYSNFQWVCALL